MISYNSGSWRRTLVCGCMCVGVRVLILVNVVAVMKVHLLRNYQQNLQELLDTDDD